MTSLQLQPLKVEAGRPWSKLARDLLGVVSSSFSERPCLKRIKWNNNSGRFPTPTLGLHTDTPTWTCVRNMSTHVKTVTQAYIYHTCEKQIIKKISSVKKQPQQVWGRGRENLFGSMFIQRNSQTALGSEAQERKTAALLFPGVIIYGRRMGREVILDTGLTGQAGKRKPGGVIEHLEHSFQRVLKSKHKRNTGKQLLK